MRRLKVGAQQRLLALGWESLVKSLGGPPTDPSPSLAEKTGQEWVPSGDAQWDPLSSSLTWGQETAPSPAAGQVAGEGQAEPRQAQLLLHLPHPQHP